MERRFLRRFRVHERQDDATPRSLTQRRRCLLDETRRFHAWISVSVHLRNLRWESLQEVLTRWRVHCWKLIWNSKQVGWDLPESAVWDSCELQVHCFCEPDSVRHHQYFLGEKFYFYEGAEDQRQTSVKVQQKLRSLRPPTKIKKHHLSLNRSPPRVRLISLHLHSLRKLRGLRRHRPIPPLNLLHGPTGRNHPGLTIWSFSILIFR